MKKVINEEGQLPIFLWLDDAESGALDQLSNLAKLPFAFHHIAAMPDCHQGYGMPIGGVLATDGVVIPNAVGVDIGCGMVVVETDIMAETLDRKRLTEMMSLIRKKIPVGFDHHKERQDPGLMPTIWRDSKIVQQEYDSALKQIGTLGGGNHFIEIQKSEKTGKIWLMIHSGSRNIGKKVADHYNGLAVDLNAKWHSSVPKAHDLAFLPVDSEEGHSYLEEMTYCINFAYNNRKLMMERMIDSVNEVMPTKFGDILNVPHNYVAQESHYNKYVWVHRKGATSAFKGEIGIIPGSQGSASYIVRGLENKDSFNSCSHGAGRKMGRKEARRSLMIDEQISKLDSMGVIHSIRSQEDLDEAPDAYKDIDTVMANQGDLVEIVEKLIPMAVIKG